MCHGSFVLISAATLALCGQAQTLTFVRQLSNPLPVADVAGAALDSTGLYVAGGLSQVQSTPSFYADAYVRKTGTDGQELWVRRLGGSATIAGIAAGSGGLYIAGQTGWNLSAQAYYSLSGQAALGFTDAFVRRYDQNGNELWTRQFGTANYDYVYGAVADSTGVYVLGRMDATYNVFPSGQVFLRKYDPAGNELWTRNLDAADARYIASDGASEGASIYVSGRFNFTNNVYPPFLRKYDSSGSEVWTRQNNGGFPGAVAANATTVYWVLDRSLFRYDPSGNQVWTRTEPWELPRAVDDSGFYALGALDSSGQCPSGEMDATVARYDLDGNQIWARVFESGGRGSALAADAAGVYAAGGSGPDGSTFVARLERTPAASVVGRPQIRNECVLNAAGFFGGGVTPGELITILGSGLGPAQAASPSEASGIFPTALAGTRVLFNGAAIPLLYVSDRQVNAVAPAALTGATVDVQVEYNGVASGTLTVAVRGPRFALFRDPSGPIVLNADGSRNSASNPAARGSLIRIFGTGAGLVNPGIPDGQILDDTSAAGLSASSQANFSVALEGCNDLDLPSTATFQGVPGFAYGLVQVSVGVPDSLPPNETPELSLQSGGYVSQVWIR